MFRSLARAPGVFSARGPMFDGIFELEPENREWDSNRPTATSRRSHRRSSLGAQEVFDVALLAGVRYPEIAEEGADAAINSFVLPEAQPAAG